MSCSSRNPIAVSISLQYFKSKNMHFIVTKWSLSIIQILMKQLLWKVTA